MKKDIRGCMFPILFFVIPFILSLSSCNTRGKVLQNLHDEQTVLDSTWSAKDITQLNSYMLNSIKNSYYVLESGQFSRKNIWVLAQSMANDTDEHINTRVLMEKFRTILIKKLGIRFVDDQALNDIIKQFTLQEKDFYDSDPSKVAKVGKMLGAKLILRGRISSIRKKVKYQNLIFYNITFQLVSIETGVILWVDDFEIKRKTISSKYY